METENQDFMEDEFQAAYCECSLIGCGRDGNWPLHYRFCYDSKGKIISQSCDCY